MTTALYRISSNEVLKISEADDLFTEFKSSFKEVAENITCPDGTDVISPSGERRILGYVKILDGTVVRNATQEEINTFAASETDDDNIRQASEATSYFQQDPKLRRILTAFADIIVSEINILRSEHGLANRTLSQLKTAIINRIDKDD